MDKFDLIFKQRVEKFLQDIARDVVTHEITLAAEYGFSTDPVPFSRRRTLAYREIREGELWGHAWDNAWFHLTGQVPESLAGQEVCLAINLSGEALLFDDAGTPRYGFSAGSIFAPSFVKERYVLNRKFTGGEALDFWIEATSNQLWGVDRDAIHPLGKYDSHVQKIRLGKFNREVYGFLVDLTVLHSLFQSCPDGDYRAHQLLRVLNLAIDAYGYTAANAARARAVLAPVLAHPALASAPEAWAVGHAHIDVGWLWRVRESRRKAARTFASQIALMEQYPGYVFGASQPVLYQAVKEDYPGLYDKIKEHVRRGDWELQGGMWVEADANLISGESMVRQFLHGKNFFRDEFGVEVKSLWLPDVFGYSGSMPQIVRKSGCDYFLTQKICWSQFNTFPHHTFHWKGVDGTRLLTHFLPENNYCAGMLPEENIPAVNRFAENAFMDKYLCAYGIGDGGGGPNEDHVERALRMRNLEGCPKVQFRRSDDFFTAIEQQFASELEEWDGELYLEFHRGTLTTQARTKRLNRKCEQSLQELEFLYSALPLGDYPIRELDRMWKCVLTNQFHDILPGSSIPQVYQEAEAEYDAVLEQAERLKQEAAVKLFRAQTGSAVLANTLSWDFSGVVELPEDWNGCGVADDAGRPLPVQNEAGHTVVLIEIPALSFVTIHRHGQAVSAAVSSEAEPVLENELIRYEFAKSGELVRAWDKTVGREVMSGNGNVLSLYNDRPHTYEAWDIDIYYPRDFKEKLRCVEARYDAAGPVRNVLRFEYRTEQSTVTQRVMLAADSKRLDFVTEVDWHESQIMLRVAFPVAIETAEAGFDIPYAYIKRPTHDNTSWEKAKFEAAGQRYADLSDAGYGVALLNDCKYGYKVKGATLGLCLLRSPKEPDFFADQGQHRFTYSLLPHEHPLADSTVIQEAAGLNRPPYCADGFRVGEAASACTLDATGIALETVKKAEKEDCLILRLVETRGRRSRGTLSLRAPYSELQVTNLIEWENGAAIPVEAGRAEIALNPFEILTLKLR